MTRPRHRADHDAVTATRHPRRLRLHGGQRRPEVQRAPAPPALPLIGSRRPAPADPATITLTPIRPGRDDHSRAVHEHVLNDRPPQPKQPRPYPDPAHVVPPPEHSSPEEAGNPRRGAACAPYTVFTSPTGTAGAPEISGVRPDCQRRLHPSASAALLSPSTTSAF